MNRPVTILDFASAPQTVTAGCQSWIGRGANFVVTLIEGIAGAVRDRDSADEYMVLPLSTDISIQAEQCAQIGPGDLAIVPPGPSTLTFRTAGAIICVCSSLAADLAAQAANAADYADGAPDVAPLTAWPEPVDGYRVRVYRLDDAVRADSNQRIFCTRHLMLNVMTPRIGARDPTRLSPHAHADFEQGSLALQGAWIHHVRTPWTADQTTWRDDQHIHAGSPSLAIIPTGAIHTSRNVGADPAWLVDVFAPPRLDFARRGLVFNGAEYPMPGQRCSMTSADDARLMDRVIWRVMPLVTLCWIIATIDRSNIGFAKLQMAHSLHIGEAVFGLGSSLFFVGYLVFEIPSALAAHRYGARLWFARIMASWGVATLLLAFTSSTTMFYLMRFVLGAAEAGLYPAALYYLSLWFGQNQMARATGFFTLGSAFGNAAGALIAGPLLDLNGVLGLAGWQWIFLVTGMLPVIATVLVLRALADTPAQAQFLTAAERVRVGVLAAPDPGATRAGHPLRVLLDRHVLGLSGVYGLILVALYGVIYWSPTVIKGFGVSGTINGMLAAAPWLVAAVLLMTIMPTLKQPGRVMIALAALAGTGAIAFALAAMTRVDGLRYAALLVGTPCISLCVACFWTFALRLFEGAARAVAIAAISTLGSIGGLIAQNLMPALAQVSGGPAGALWAPSLCLAAIAAGSVVRVKR